MKNVSLLIVFLSLLSIAARSQNTLDKAMSLTANEEQLKHLLHRLSTDYNIPISFSNSILPDNFKVNGTWSNVPFRIILKAILKKTNIGFEGVGNQIVLYKIAREYREKFTIGGYVEDAATGERLIGANLYELNTQKGAFTNAYGFYSLTLSSGEVQLIVSFLGYKSEIISFYLQSDRSLKVELKPSVTLDEIVIKASKVANDNAGVFDNLPTDLTGIIPTIGGESDILQMARSRPGVQSGAGGIGGLHVRGGSPDQNLILLDDVPVYNSTHTWGVFSIFNSDAVQSTRFYKGAFPANYGGRLSSVLDVRTKEGNNKAYHGEAELGLISAKTAVEGPILKDKASFFISARRALLDIYSRPYFRTTRAERGIEGTIDYYFYDLNLKLNYSAGQRDKFYLSLYRGRDTYGEDHLQRFHPVDTTVIYKENTDRQWGNDIAAFRWNRNWNNRLFSNSTLTYSRYFYESRHLIDLKAFGEENKFLDILSLSQYNSNIEDRSLKMDFTYYPSPHYTLSFGGRVAQYIFQPGVVSISEDVRTNDSLRDSITISLDTFWRRSSLRAYETNIYGEISLEIGKRGQLTPGFYLAGFSAGDKTYLSFQPRIRFNWMWNQNFFTGLSGERMTQFLHLLSASTIGLPNDIWVSATKKVKPQESWQVAAWWSLHLKNDYHLKVEGYYKKLDNLVEFQNLSSSLINASNWENNIIHGAGWNYGIETELAKIKGKTTGWINYTYAHAQRQFDDISSEDRFPFRYDRRHVINLAIVQKLGKKWKASAKWVFATGLATSLPVGRYITVSDVSLPPIEVFTFDSRNAFRMPSYHHLDIQFNYNWKRKAFEHTLKMGVHNIYFRKNPIYYDLIEDRRYNQIFIPPLLPSVSYKLKI